MAEGSTRIQQEKADVCIRLCGRFVLALQHETTSLDMEEVYLSALLSSETIAPHLSFICTWVFQDPTSAIVSYGSFILNRVISFPNRLWEESSVEYARTIMACL